MQARRTLHLLVALMLLWGALPLRAQKPAEPTAVYQTSSSLSDAVPLDVRVKIEPTLLKQLLEAEGQATQRSAEQRRGMLGVNQATVTFFVNLVESAPLADLASVTDADVRRAQVTERLQATARRSQSSITRYLDGELATGIVKRYTSFWIFNGLLVEGPLRTALALAARDDVKSLTPNRTHQLSAPVVEETSATPAWNITKIGANRVWETLGITGQGIVVANLDTGVDWTHPALQSKYRGYNSINPASSTHDYSWYDPTGTYPNAPGPNRPAISTYSDHGTHTMGSIVGSDAAGVEQVGVAPGATWVAVKVFDDQGSATDEWIHLGFQWCLAPTRLDGSSPDAALAPDIVSNSWGDDDNPRDATFQPDVFALRAAGILTVFAAGNNGPDSGTVGSPASIGGVFAVGATDSQDNVAGFSARGPSPWGEIKPEVTAPGAGVRSSIAGGSYASWGGTSMATPHVAGLAALIWQADRLRATSVGVMGHPENQLLTITSTEYIITSTVVDLGAPEEDNTYGYGRIDAYEAVSTILQSGSVAGRVTDLGTGAPLADVQLTLVSRATGGQHRATSATDGSYTFVVAEGLYDLSTTKYGYETAHARDIEVLASTQTQLDLQLVAQPTGILRGRVTVVGSGLPIAATVSIVGTPASTFVDAQGYYTLTAVAGTCTVRALPENVGYRGAEVTDVVVPANGTTTLDLYLEEAPRILLVDADANAASYATVYRADLDSLLLSYAERAIFQSPQDNPTAAELSAFDLVIWSQPTRSPGYIGAWDALGGYLEQGGWLLLSGQDIGYWDDALEYGRDAYRHYLHAEYVSNDAGLDTLTGARGGALEGLSLTYNTADSAGNQTAPDAIRQSDGLAEALVDSASGALVGLASDACSYRTVYLSFGLEGVGPSDVRQQALSRVLTWFTHARPARAALVNVPVAQQLVASDSTATYRFWVVNQGQTPARFDLAVDSPEWPAQIVHPLTGQIVSDTGQLAPCAAIELHLQVEAPPHALLNDRAVSVVYARSAGETLASDTVYTGAVGVWRSAPAMPQAHYRHVVAAVGCRLVAIGGFVGEEDDAASGRVDVLDLATGVWSLGSPKPTPAANAGVAVLAGRVYVLGGYNPAANPQTLATVEVYDMATDTWGTAPLLPVPLSGAAATALDGRIYVFGGRTGNDESTDGYVLDEATGVWTTLAPLPSSDAAYASAAALDGLIYVAGGWPNRTQLLRYDPAQDSWTTLAPMHTGRHSAALIAVDGYLYVAGGGVEWAGLNKAERYDPTLNAWLDLPALNDASRAGTSGAYADGRFYVVGGTGDESSATVEYLDIAPALGGSQLTVTEPIVQAGEALGYELVLRNPAAQQVQAGWSHLLPLDLDYVPGSATGGAVYNAGQRTLSWSGALEASSVCAFAFAARVKTTVADGTTITSTVRLVGGGCSPTVVTAHTRAFVPSLAPSAKTVDKSLAAAGEWLHYSVRLANASPFTISQATMVDDIPAHTRFVPGSLTGGASYNAALNRVEWSGSLAAAPDADLAFDWIDATDGQALALTDDSSVGPLDLGFQFEFYGNVYSQIHVNSNGMVLFGKGSTAYSNAAIPNVAEPNNYIAAFWDDLTPGDGGVYLAVHGTAPRRYAVVEWHNVRIFGGSQAQTFEVVLYEGSNVVALQYLDMNGERGAGSSATVGLENATGTAGTQHLFNGGPAEHALYDGLLLEMTHSSTRKISTHLVAYDVIVDDVVPPLTVITNTARLDDGLAVHERTAVTAIESADFSTSTKQVGDGFALSGDIVSYELRIVNSGTRTATDARLVDTLPAELTLTSLPTGGATFDPTTRQIRWQGAVAPGTQGVTIAYLAELQPALPSNTRITNTAVIYEQDVQMATLTAGILVNPVLLEGSTKTAHAAQVQAGELVTYTIRMYNHGVTAPEATLTDVLPLGLELMPGTLEGADYDAARRTIHWQGELPGPGERNVRYVARTAMTLTNGTLLTNTAEIGDGNGGLTARQATVRILRGDLATSDLRVDRPVALAGEVVTYTVRLRNTGAAGIDATWHCAPPALLSVDPDSLYSSSGLLWWDAGLHWQGSVSAQAVVIVRFSARIAAEATPQRLTTEATLTDAGGISTPLSAVLQVNRPGEMLLYLPQVYRLP